MTNAGLYLHFPFCTGKCPYCDFYSVKADEKVMDAYIESAIRELERQRAEFGSRFDTVYFGGGTPSVLGAKRLARAAEAVLNSETKRVLTEFTVECNPTSSSYELFEALAKAGVNRISMGLQSAVDSERAALGRKGSVESVKAAVEAAKRAGIENISLDLMLGIPNQTRSSLMKSIDFCAESGAKHISAYLLKIEENTPFYKIKDKLAIPDDDSSSELYLYACEELEKAGYRQYEISNFAVTGYESRHNLKYWRCEEYLGIGPAAHSFMHSERFFYPRELERFINQPETVFDSHGGDFEEYAMLALRLREGLREKETLERYGFGIPAKMRNSAERFKGKDLLYSDSEGIRFTRNGFLLSNALICELLYD